MRNMDDATRMMLMASTTPLGKSAEGGADISVPAGRQVIPHSARARLISSAQRGRQGALANSYLVHAKYFRIICYRDAHYEAPVKGILSLFHPSYSFCCMPL